MNKKDVYARGYNTGYDIAKANQIDTTAPFSKDQLDLWLDEVIETEQEHFRQFSPFEFFAYDLNHSHDPEGLWESYDDGVYAGAKAYIRQFKRENKDSFIRLKITV